MKLIVGLGNPGEKYRATRHNVGVVIVDSLARRLANSELGDDPIHVEFNSRLNPVPALGYQLETTVVLFTKSGEFMNSSGLGVKRLLVKNRILPKDLLIVHDDLDLPLGSCKMQLGKGPRLHNGVLSVENELGTKEFWRLRVGIEARDERLAVSGEEYVLQDFTGEERKVIDQLIEEKIVPEIKNWLLKI